MKDDGGESARYNDDNREDKVGTVGTRRRRAKKGNPSISVSYCRAAMTKFGVRGTSELEHLPNGIRLRIA